MRGERRGRSLSLPSYLMASGGAGAGNPIFPPIRLSARALHCRCRLVSGEVHFYEVPVCVTRGRPECDQ